QPPSPGARKPLKLLAAVRVGEHGALWITRKNPLFATRRQQGPVVPDRPPSQCRRNYADVTDVIREFIRRGVIVRTVINGLTFDGATKDPMQMAVRDALIAFMAATAQAQAEATKEAQRAGILYAQSHDDGTKFRGRKPSFDWADFAAVQNLLSQGIAVAEIAKT